MEGLAPLAAAPSQRATGLSSSFLAPSSSGALRQAPSAGTGKAKVSVGAPRVAVPRAAMSESSAPGLFEAIGSSLKGLLSTTQNGKASGAGLSSKEIMEIESKVLVHTYARTPIVIARGKGSTLVDTDGKEYIDMASGIAVNALGHSDPDWLRAVTQQAAELAHVSNLYYTWPMVNLAKRLVDYSFADRVFFANSGTEANEAAIKFARKYQLVQSQGVASHATEFVSFSNCFHGRTMGALALTYKEGYRTPFEPVMPGAATFAEYGSLESAAAAIKKGKTAAVFVEPVQGEGGVYPATKEFLSGLRKLCDDAGALLIFDEVQCGLGRTGYLWAHEAYGVTPDIMTLAKPLAGGLPIGAVLVTERVASAISPGDHGSTFAGNPLVCSAAHAVLDRIAEPRFLNEVTNKGEKLRSLLRAKLSSCPNVKEIRGVGLIVGIQLDVPAGPMVEAARENGILAITAGKGDVVRLVPPLVITEGELEKAVDMLAKSAAALQVPVAA